MCSMVRQSTSHVFARKIMRGEWKGLNANHRITYQWVFYPLSATGRKLRASGSARACWATTCVIYQNGFQFLSRQSVGRGQEEGAQVSFEGERTGVRRTRPLEKAEGMEDKENTEGSDVWKDVRVNEDDERVQVAPDMGAGGSSFQATSDPEEEGQRKEEEHSEARGREAEMGRLRRRGVGQAGGAGGRTRRGEAGRTVRGRTVRRRR